MIFRLGKSIFRRKICSTVWNFKPGVLASVRLKYRLSAWAGKDWLSGAVRVTFSMSHYYRICNTVVIDVNIETST